MPQTTKLLPVLWGSGAETGGAPALAVFDKVTEHLKVTVSSHLVLCSVWFPRFSIALNFVTSPTPRVNLVEAVPTDNPGPTPELTATPHPLVFC